MRINADLNVFGRHVSLHSADVYRPVDHRLVSRTATDLNRAPTDIKVISCQESFEISRDSPTNKMATAGRRLFASTSFNTMVGRQRGAMPKTSTFFDRRRDSTAAASRPAPRRQAASMRLIRSYPPGPI